MPGLLRFLFFGGAGRAAATGLEIAYNVLRVYEPEVRARQLRKQLT